jgi:hypothetical protein
MKKLALLFLALPLAACGYDTYQKPGATENQVAWDQTVCQNYALAQPVAAVPGHQKVNGIGVWPEDQLNDVKANKDFRSCMLGKGYSYEHNMSFRTANNRQVP